MTDKEIANKLILWVIERRYWEYNKYEARKLAIGYLSEIKRKYGFKMMKKAFNEKDCTSLVKFEKLCRDHTKLNK